MKLYSSCFKLLFLGLLPYNYCAAQQITIDSIFKKKAIWTSVYLYHNPQSQGLSSDDTAAIAYKIMRDTIADGARYKLLYAKSLGACGTVPRWQQPSYHYHYQPAVAYSPCGRIRLSNDSVYFINDVGFYPYFSQRYPLGVERFLLKFDASIWMAGSAQELLHIGPISTPYGSWGKLFCYDNGTSVRYTANPMPIYCDFDLSCYDSLDADPPPDTDTTRPDVKSFGVYPNPLSGSRLNISVEDFVSVAGIRIYDMQGRVAGVFTPLFVNGHIEIEVKEEAGIYIIMLMYKDGSYDLKKLVRL